MKINLGLCGVLFLILLVLRLTENIDWSWWWVTAPLWGLQAVYWSVYILVSVMYAPFWFIKKRRKANFEHVRFQKY